MLSLWSFKANADIFKADPEDYQITSAMDVPFKFTADDTKPLMTRLLQRDQEIQESIKNLVRANVKFNMGRSPLLLWQYSAPAEADVFKHYQTMAHLRFAFDYERLKELENNSNQDLNELRNQDFFECVEKKYFLGRFTNNIAGLLDSCRNGGVFKELRYADQTNVFAKLLRKFNVPKLRQEKIIPLLPVVRVTPNDIFIAGPEKRIGHVLKEKRDQGIARVSQLLRTYKNRIDPTIIEKLSVPSRPFTELDIAFLLSLSEKKQKKQIAKIVAHIALIQTIDQYNDAIDWLERDRMHPQLDQAYKNIFIKGIAFLESEKKSLTQKIKAIEDYTIVIDTMIEASQQDQMENYKRLKADAFNNGKMHL